MPGKACVWSKISNALKRLGFQSHNFLAQLLSETSSAEVMKNRFHSVAKGETGVLWCRFREQKGNSGSNPWSSVCRSHPLAVQ
jgi:hypothetical protein